MRKQRTIALGENELLHVETPLGIVNIRTGLADSAGRRVNSIETIANDYAGEPKVIIDGYSNTRLIETEEVPNRGGIPAAADAPMGRED